ncbi:MAG: transaldolase [Candidatus Thermoplasmatota archaeon]|nr:transaldolase [Candidatus Thermoplasmatota archaeon]MBU1941025.1 transaldolase [Candidatus Thermoplasmatota archaeon]
MKIFVDSAKLHEIKEAYSFGILDGVTTNPSLLKQAVTELQKTNKKISLENYIKDILLTAKGTPVSLEVTEYINEKMVSQAKALYHRFNPIVKNVNIKIPINTTFPGKTGNEFDGLKTIKTLSEAKIPTNCTLIFTPEQALLAAKAGATYVSPFAGRIDDYLRKQHNISFNKTDYYPAEGMLHKDKLLQDNGIVSGVDLVAQIVDLFDIYGYNTEVIAASLRNTQQVREVAMVGADIATIPFSVIKELLTHYKTQEGMQKFTEDIVPEYVTLTQEY